MLRSFYQPALPPGGISKDPTVWIDRDRKPPKNISKNNMTSTNSKIWPIQTIQIMTEKLLKIEIANIGDLIVNFLNQIAW